MLCRCDDFADQTSQPANIAGGIDGIAEANDDEMLRRQDHDALAEIAGGKKASRGIPRLTRRLAFSCSLRLVQKPAP